MRQHQGLHNEHRFLCSLRDSENVRPRSRPRFLGKVQAEHEDECDDEDDFHRKSLTAGHGEVMVMFGSSVKIDADLLKRCKQHAQDAGYSSVEEFIAHVLERELKSKQEESEKDQEEIARRLQGLGYIE